MIGDETLLKFSGVPLGEACSIVIRGATEQILGEAERSLHDALCVLTSTVKNTKTVLGGGNFIIKSGCGCATLEERRRQSKASYFTTIRKTFFVFPHCYEIGIRGALEK